MDSACSWLLVYVKAEDNLVGRDCRGGHLVVFHLSDGVLML
jgi:hypothetical protein